MEYSTLPRQFQDPTAQKTAQRKYKALLNEAQEAFGRLLSNRDLQPLPLTLEGITTEWVDRIAKSKAERVDDPMFSYMTDEQRTAQKSLINQWHQCVLADVQTLIKFRDSVPSESVGYDNNSGPYYKDIEALADAAATKEVPALANEHWAMVQQLFAALDGLREFEQRNGINSLGLEHLLGAKNDPQKFAEWWCLNIFQPSENSITRRFYVRGNAYL